jgi:hypothetical protein
MIEEANEARLELPAASSFDVKVEWLQDACNELRADLRRRDAEIWPFGESLLEFAHWYCSGQN